MTARKIKGQETPIPVEIEEVSQAIQPQQASAEPVIAPPSQKVHMSVKDRVGSLKNSPWLLLTVPLLFVALVGAVWLGNNIWIITNNLNKPYMLLAGPATIGSIVAIWFLVNFFKAIITAIKNIWTAIVTYNNKMVAVLWIGTIAFLCVSVAEGSTTFNELFADNAHGLLGFAAAIVIDVVSIICILARQGAVRRNNEKGKQLFMLGVLICAAASTIANGYSTHEHYVAPPNIAGTVWVLGAYALGTLPPLLIVFLGIAADFINDQVSSDLDPDAFEASEKNRIRFEEIQLEAMKKKLAIQKQRNELSGRIDKKLIKQAKTQAKIDKIKSAASGRSVPLISFALRKPEPVDYAKLVEELVPAIAEKVKAEPVNYEQIRATIIRDVKPLIPTPVPTPEPLNIDDLSEKLAPMIAKQVAPEPVDYDQIAHIVAPLLAPQMRTLRATIVEEIRTIAPQIVAPAPQVRAGKNPGKKATLEVNESTIEARLEMALQSLLEQQKRPSGRALAEIVRCNRGSATDWLKVTHPEYASARNNGSDQSHMLEPLEDDDNATLQGDPEPQEYCIHDESGSDTEQSESHFSEPMSEELLAIGMDSEPVLL